MDTPTSTCAACGGGIGPKEIVFSDVTSDGQTYHQDCMPDDLQPYVIGEVRLADE